MMTDETAIMTRYNEHTQSQFEAVSRSLLWIQGRESCHRQRAGRGRSRGIEVGQGGELLRLL